MAIAQSIRPPAPLRKPPVSSARRKRRKHHPLFIWGGLEAPAPVKAALPFDPKKLQVFAQAIWRASGHPHGMLVTRWLTSQGLRLPDDVGIDVVRFHPSLKLQGDERTPAAVFLLRDLHTDETVGIVRHFLDLDGKLIRRKTLGQVFNSAVKLCDDDQVTEGLHVCADVATGLTAMSQGYRPLWVISALADLPVLAGIECLTVIAAPDDAAAQAVASRWQASGRDVRIVTAENETPQQGDQPCCGEFFLDHRQEVR